MWKMIIYSCILAIIGLQYDSSFALHRLIKPGFALHKLIKSGKQIKTYRKTYEIPISFLNSIIINLKASLHILITSYKMDKSNTLEDNMFSIVNFVNNDFRYKTIGNAITALESIGDSVGFDVEQTQNILKLAGKVYYDRDVVDLLLANHTLNDLKQVYEVMNAIKSEIERRPNKENIIFISNTKISQTKHNNLRQAYYLISADIKNMINLANSLKSNLSKMEGNNYSSDIVETFQKQLAALAEKVVLYTIQFGDQRDWRDYREDIKVTDNDLRELQLSGKNELSEKTRTRNTLPHIKNVI